MLSSGKHDKLREKCLNVNCYQKTFFYFHNNRKTIALEWNCGCVRGKEEFKETQFSVCRLKT